MATHKLSRSAVTVAILFGALSTVMLDRFVGSFLGPYIVKDLLLTPGQIGMLAAATAISWSVSALVFGAVSDRIGRRVVLVPAMFAFSACSWLSGLAQSFEQLLLVRLALGVAEGPCWSVIMALVEESTEPRHRARNIGIVNSAGPLSGAAIAPIFATQVASAFGWRWGFFGAAIPGLIFGLLILLFVPEQPREARPRAAGTVAAMRDAAEILVYPQLWLCLVGAFGFVTSLMAFTVFAPLYLTTVMHQTPTTAGFLLGAAGLGGAIWCMFGTGIADRVGRKHALMGFAVLSAMATLLFMVRPLYGTPWLLAGVTFTLSAGPAAGALVLALLPAELVPRHHVAAAIGFAGIGAEMLGGTLAPALGGRLGDAFGLTAPMLLSVAGSATVLVIAILIRETLTDAQR